MRLPRALARLAFPWVASKTAVSREWSVGLDARKALEEARAAGCATEWEARNAAIALAKVRGISVFDAVVAVRVGLVAGLVSGSAPVNPGRADLLRAAWRGERIVDAVKAARAARRRGTNP